MPLLKVGPLEDLAPGQVTEVNAGDRTFAVCNVNGQFHGMDGMCPHAGGPLGQGALHGDKLVCPWHGWEFSCVTGANDEDEDVTVEKFDVVVRDGMIFLDVPES